MSLAEVFAMGGHGKFVWSAYGITFAVLVLNLLFALKRLRKSERDISGSDSATRPEKGQESKG